MQLKHCGNCFFYKNRAFVPDLNFNDSLPKN